MTTVPPNAGFKLFPELGDSLTHPTHPLIILLNSPFTQALTHLLNLSHSHTQALELSLTDLLMHAGIVPEDDDDDDDDCDEEDEALDRYAPSQAGRAVAGLQHTHSHRAPRPPISNDTGTTQDTDDWHKSRSLFNVVWSEQDDIQETARQPGERAQRTSSMRLTRSSSRSYLAGSDNNV